jgi:hypothetical protein
MPWRYDPDYAGIGRYLREDAELKAELHRRADLGLTLARALAPRLKAPRDGRIPGALAASGHIEDLGVAASAPGRFGDGQRMTLAVVFDISYAAAATYRFRHNPNEAARAYLLAAIPVIER